MKHNDPTKVITGKNCVMSYLTISEPKSTNGGKEKYSVSIIIPKSDRETERAIRAAIQAAYEAGQNKLRGSNGKVPPLDKVWYPLRDGDEERPEDEAYRNAWFVSAKSLTKPNAYDRAGQKIQDTEDATVLYSGIIGRASINFYAFNVDGNRGIACGLNAIQKIADGTPLGGRHATDDDFDALEEDDGEDFLA